MTRSTKRKHRSGSKPSTAPGRVIGGSGKPIKRFSQIDTNPHLPTVTADPAPMSKHPPRSGVVGPQNVRRAMQISQSFSGPLPPPQLLAQYNDAMPDGANRIMMMAERQEHHRQEIELYVIRGDSRRADRGQVFAFVIALAFGAGAIWLAQTGHETAASVIGGSTVLGLVSLFVTGTIARRNERIKKNEITENLKSPKSSS